MAKANQKKSVKIKVNPRDQVWLTMDEKKFIAEKSESLSGNERTKWLSMYEDVCLKKTNWGNMSRSSVLRHIEDLLAANG